MPMNISPDVVKQLRIKRGWTQEHLADVANVNVRTIQRIEKSGVCDIETRSALASVFQVDVQQIDGEKKIEQATPNSRKRPLTYQRIVSGQGIVDIFTDAHAYRFTNEEPRSKEDAEYIAWFVNHVKDYSEAWSDIELGDRITATYEFGENLKDFEAQGFHLFGLRTKMKANPPPSAPSAESDYLRVANFHVAYGDSNKIFVLNPSAGI